MNIIICEKISGEQAIFYSNIFDETKSSAKFIILYIDHIDIYSFYLEKINVINPDKKAIKTKKDIWKNVVPNISNIDNLRYSANLEEKVISKNYLNIPEIMEELENNYKNSLDEKKLEVKNIMETKDLKSNDKNTSERLDGKNKISQKEQKDNYEKPLDKKQLEIINKNELNYIFDLDYIQLIKLIIKDNTNKTLIIEYLNYLYKNQENLKLKYKDNIEMYQKEYENYKCLFNNEELKENKLKEKTLSQKQVFINLLEKIRKIDINSFEDIEDKGNDINNNDNEEKEDEEKEEEEEDEEDEVDIKVFKNKVDKKIKHIQLFNQPINFSNDELYWQRNCNVLYFALKKILQNKIQFQLLQQTINKILDKKIFDKDYIIKDNILLTNIMILLAIPQPNDYIEYNLNLIETKDPNYNYIEEIKMLNLTKLQDKNSYYLSHKNQGYFLNEPSSKCVKNFVLNIQNEMNLEEFEQRTYDKMKDFFNDIINFDNIKILLSKIFTSNVFREAFAILYPTNYQFPFRDENDALNFLNKYYHFIPLKTSNTAAVTERFSSEIYYLLKKRKNFVSIKVSEKNKYLIKKILYNGSTVKTSCNEINHEFYNLLLMQSNGKIPLEATRKKYINEREGRRNMEMLLFNLQESRLFFE